jgi:uncharacterized glyoxalase superfamily protein PhnB
VRKRYEQFRYEDPCMRYGTRPRLESHLAVSAEGNRIAHAQLTFGNGIIMLASNHDNGYSRMMKEPDEIGGAGTQSTYIVTRDTDACGRYRKGRRPSLPSTRRAAVGASGVNFGQSRSQTA